MTSLPPLSRPCRTGPWSLPIPLPLGLLLAFGAVFAPGAFAESSGEATVNTAERQPLVAPRPGNAEPQRAGSSPADRKVLTQSGITPDAEGLRNYLERLTPADDDAKVIAKWVRKMSSRERYATRQNAMLELVRLPRNRLAPLERHREAADPEVRRRVNSILFYADRESRALLSATIRVIHADELPGMCDVLIASAEHIDEEYVIESIERACYNTLDPENQADIAAVLKLLVHPEPRQRQLGGLLAERLPLEIVREPLVNLEGDPSENVRYWAARTRLALGDETALPSMTELLASKSNPVRSRAFEVLFELTGESYDYTLATDAESRQASIDRWKSWIRSEAAVISPGKLRSPFAFRVSYLGGNTLIASGYRNTVYELDPSGKEVWSYKAQGAWSAEKLSNGNVLIAAHTENEVMEIDAKGKKVWTFGIRYPIAARPMNNGNILVTTYSPGGLREVTRSGEVVWQHTTKGSAYDAHPLPNGNVLYIAGNKVIEVTKDRREVWSYDAQSPYGIMPLRNGRILISESKGRVIEIDRQKNIHWEQKADRPSDAFRLPSGNTLITGSKEVIEVTPDHRIVWRRGNTNYGSARR